MQLFLFWLTYFVTLVFCPPLDYAPMLQSERSTLPPKNIILFIGDGMGLSTITAARYRKAELFGEEAGEVTLDWENWPVVSLVRTFNLDRMTTDSASAATALLGGVKVLGGTMGLMGIRKCCQCEPFTPDQLIETSMIKAQKRGLSTGLVTTTRITHATPAAAYAYAYQRDTEAKPQISATNRTFTCEDIASQLIDRGHDFNVIFGGGWKKFLNSTEQNKAYPNGERTDGRNLLEEWKLKQEMKGRKHQLIMNRTELMGLNMNTVDYVLGLFAADHLAYELESRPEEPRMDEMTLRAIELLSRNPKGYFLLVEGGRIDHGHHKNQARYALSETLALENAVRLALTRTSRTDTLILVTADHSHPYNLVGKVKRTRSVLDTDDEQIGTDQLPYLVSAYANGPGAKINESRGSPNVSELFHRSFRQQALVPLEYSTHSAEDVPLYAIGPYSGLFHSTIDNTFVAHATMFALCLDPYEKASHCVQTSRTAAIFTFKQWKVLLPIMLIHWLL